MPRKVLLVEDDNNLREIFEMRLQAEGYKTISAGDGEEALVVAVKEKPDLVIADVMMPKLSGFEMVENMRAVPELANTKVIMMTALGQAEDRARGEKLGVVKYLVKSQVTLEDFARIVLGVMPPDGSEPAASPAPADKVADQPNNINQQESETSMQDDAQQQNNPVPDAGAAPAGDAGVPSSDAVPSPNPISDTPAAPLGGASSGDQQSTAEETSAVQDQIDNFESDPAAGSAPSVPGADAGMPPAGDSMPPAPDATGMPAANPPVDSPAPDAGGAPAADPNMPAADPAAPPQDAGAPTDPNSNAL
jgi:CheY-like chemotaxis protein